MWKLISLGAVAVVFILFLVFTALAGERVKATLLCAEPDHIAQLANANMESVRAFEVVVNRLMYDEGVCLILPAIGVPFVTYEVDELLLQAKDFEGDPFAAYSGWAINDDGSKASMSYTIIYPWFSESGELPLIGRGS